MRSAGKQRRKAKSRALVFALSFTLSLLSTQLSSYAAAPEAVKLNNKGVQAINEGNFPAAISILEHAVQVDPDYLVARENLAIAHNNYALSLIEEPEKALHHFHRAVYLAPHNETNKKNLSGLLKRMKRDPESFEDRVQLAEESKKKGDYLGAEVEYRSALDLHDDAKVREEYNEVTRLAAEKHNIPTPSRKAQIAELLARAQKTRSQSQTDEGSSLEKSSTEKSGKVDNEIKVDISKYIASVEEKIQTKWVPPAAHESNEVTTEFKIEPSGKLFDPKVLKSSGSVLWDDAALEALKHASPFAPLPENIYHAIQITYTFEFKNDGKLASGAVPSLSGGKGTGKTEAGQKADSTKSGTGGKTWDERLIAKMDLSAQWHRSFAEKYGEAFERNNNLIRAKDMYTALVNAMAKVSSADEKKVELPKYQKDLARANAFLALKQNQDGDKSAALTMQALKTLDDSHWLTETTRKALLEVAVESIETSKSALSVNKALADAEGIPVDTRSALTDMLLHAAIKNNESTTDISEFTKQMSIYHTKIVNLPDANSAASKAFEYEKEGQFQAAIDEYELAFRLKERSLGTTDEITLEAESDIARVMDEGGHASESQRLYEKTLDSFRRFHPFSYRYERVLLAFGDFLARHDQSKKADYVYGEATAIYKSRTAAATKHK